MYLYGYLNGKFFGCVDIDIVVPTIGKELIIAHDQNAMDHLEGLSLIMGKRIKYMSPEDSYYAKISGKLPPLVYVTKKVGRLLSWDDIRATLTVGKP